MIKDCSKKNPYPPQSATVFFCRWLSVRPSVLLKEIAFFPGRVIGQYQLLTVGGGSPGWLGEF